MKQRDWPTYIRGLIEKAGLTQAQFAREIGVDQATVTRWLNGSTKPRAGLTQRAVVNFAKKIGG